MFREMRRPGQALSLEECIRLLTEETRGVLSLLGDEGYPYGVPLNHYYDPADGALYFHGGLEGHRVDAFRRCGKASFCVYDRGVSREGEWAKTVNSVIVFGRLTEVGDRGEVLRISRLLSLKFTRDEAYIRRELEQAGPRTLLLRLTPEHMTGKRVLEA